MKQLLCALALTALLGGCARGERALIVFAAASLADAFEGIAVDFEAAHPGVEVLFSFAGSSTLAAQIAEGAPADVFASANPRQMEAVRESGRLSADPVVFAYNRLALIVPTGDTAGVGSVGDLARPGLRILIASEGVPLRDYTERMLSALAGDADYGTAFVDGFRANVISEEPNARQVAAKIALGEAGAAIVYTSDVTPTLREAVRVLEIPDAANTTAEYPMAILSNSARPELAQAWIEAVLSDEGQAALAAWGFMTVCVDAAGAAVACGA